MDIRKIIKEEILKEASVFSNPLKGTGAELASGEEELRAASRFTLDKIKDSFRKSGIYVDDNYLESFVSIDLIKSYKKGFDFKFKILEGEDSGEIRTGKAVFKTMVGSSLVLYFVSSEDNRKSYIIFKGQGSDSLDRTFLVKQKVFQKLRKRTDLVIKGLQKGGKFMVKIVNLDEGDTHINDYDVETVPTNKIGLINVGIQTSLDYNDKGHSNYILPTTSEIDSDMDKIRVVGTFKKTNDVGSDKTVSQLENELNRFWGNKMKAWASDYKNQIMLQKEGSGGYVVIEPKDTSVKKNYKDIRNYDGVRVIIGPKAFEDKNVTEGIEGIINLKIVS